MNRLVRLSMCVTLAVALAAGSDARADRIIGVNFNGGNFSGHRVTNVGDVFVLPEYASATWTDAGAGGAADAGDRRGTNIALNGAPQLELDYLATNPFQVGRQEDTDQQLYRGYLDDGDNGRGQANTTDLETIARDNDGYGVAIRITGLAAWLKAEKAGAYVVRPYFNTDSSASVPLHPLELVDGTLVTNTDGSDLAAAALLESVSATTTGNGAFPTGNTSGSQNNNGTRGFGDSSQYNLDNLVLRIEDRAGSTRGSLAGFRLIAISAPEPSSLLLVAMGVAGLGLIRPRRKTRRSASSVAALAFLSILLIPSSDALATTISVNFSRSTNLPTPLAATDVAGVEAVDDWNNIQSDSQTGSSTTNNLSDNGGNVTSTDITYFNRFWRDGVSTATPNQTMQSGYTNTNTTSNDVISFGEIGYKAYDVIVYLGGTDSMGINTPIEVGANIDGGADQWIKVWRRNPVSATLASTTFPTEALAQASSTESNYIRFTDLSGSSFDLNILKDPSSTAGWSRAAVRGIQIVDTTVYAPEPSSLLLVAIGVVTLGVRRRSKGQRS